jgi:hypothetical protein
MRDAHAHFGRGEEAPERVDEGIGGDRAPWRDVDMILLTPDFF